MSASVVYYLHAIKTGDDAIQLVQLSDVAPNNNYADLSEKSSSQVGPQFTGSHQAVPDIKFSTPQAKTILDAAIAGAFNCAVDLSAVQVLLEYRAGKPFGTRTAKNSTLGITGLMDYNALLAIEQISCRQGGLLEVRARLVSVMSGSVVPLLFTALQDISSTAQIGNLYTLGPVKLNGSFVGGVESWTLDNQIEYEEVISDGDPFLTYVAVKSIKPRFTFQTRHTDQVAAWGAKGTALSALNVFGRKKLKSGINVADATAEHIKIIATEGTIKAHGVSGDSQLAEVCVDIHETTEDTAPYSISTTSAIS